MTVAAISPTPQTAPVDPIAPTSAPTAVAPTMSQAAPVLLPTSLPQSPQAPALSSATAAAAMRQSALAPLLADLAQALAAPTTPAPVQAAISQVLSLQTPVEQPPTATGLQQATTSSGLFLEARLASGAAPVADLKMALLVVQQTLSVWLEDAGATHGEPAVPQSLALASSASRHAG